MNGTIDFGLDKRLNAYRDDLADARLKGKAEAARFVDGSSAWVKRHFVDVLGAPDEGAGLQTQFLYGHGVTVFDHHDGWAWVQGQTDSYVGYVPEAALSTAEDEFSKPTHMVSAPRTFLYPDADLKKPRCGYRSMGSRLCVLDFTTTRGTEYAILNSGEAVIAGHLIELGQWAPDPVSVAETLLHAPYLWGGNTGFGLDCSGLIWLANLLCGNNVLRDSDMQAQSTGREIAPDFDRLKRGDLVFWRGHVGMMTDPLNMIHANGNTMNVALEQLEGAIARIGYLYGQPTAVRRP